MLHTLKPASGSRRRAKRIARGNSGKGGTTGGRGTKGQHARAGKGMRFGFEGGQTPLLRRQPKLGGFKRKRKITFEPLNLALVERRLPEGSYSLSDLRAKRLLTTNNPVKLLGSAVSKKYELEVHAASIPAKDAMQKAGGKVTILPRS